MGKVRSKKPERPARLIGYGRVSTDSQADSGLSLAAQREKLRLYGELHDVEIVDIVAEVASARSLDRPKLQRILKDLRKGRANGILVVKLDRLTRSVADLGALLQDFASRDLALVSVEDRLDTSTAAGRLVLHVMASVGQWEREVIGERTRAGLAELQRQGRATGGAPPYGFNKLPGGVLVPVEAEQAVLRRARELLASGLNQVQVAEALGREGFRPRRGARFFQNQVRRWASPRAFEAAALSRTAERATS